MPQLVDTVEELDKDLRPVAHIRLRVVLASLGEHVAERDPILLNQHLEAFKCAVVGVEEELAERAKLRSSIPSIRAMDKDVALVHLHSFQNFVRTGQDTHQDLAVARAFKDLKPVLALRLIVEGDNVGHFMHFLEGLSHDMDVVNVAKEYTTVLVGRVKTAIFVPAPFELVCAGIQERSSIENLHNASLVLRCTVANADRP